MNTRRGGTTTTDRLHAYQTLRGCAVVSVVSFLAYLNTLSSGFAWDDRGFVVENAVIRDWRNAPRLFISSFAASTDDPRSARYYRPLVILSYLIDHQFSALRPAGYHLTNIVLHAANACLVFLCASVLAHAALPARRQGDRTGRAAKPCFPFMAALLFALHPTHVESVAWVSGRTDMLAACCVLASFYLYVLGERSRRRGGARRMAYASGAFAAFVVGLFAKEVSAALPLVLVAYDRLFAPRIVLRRHVPWFAAIAVYLAIRAAVLGVVGSGLGAAHSQAPLLARLATAPKVLVEYLWLLMLPTGLNAEREVDLARSVWEPGVVLGVTALVLVALWVARSAKRRPVLTLGLVWTGCFFLPVLNIIPIPELIAERFIYVPSAGFCVASGVLLAEVTSRLGRRTCWLPALLLVPLSLGTVERNADWRSERGLFGGTVRSSPDCARTRAALARVLEEHEFPSRRVIRQYRAATRLSPDFVEAHNNLGNLYRKLGQLQLAREELVAALQYNPGQVVALCNLGRVCLQDNDLDEAMTYFS